MCGIAGWVDYNADLAGDIKEKTGSVNKIMGDMVKALEPRGPDSSGYWSCRQAALGHRRLAVMDPAGGSQPMIREFAGRDYIIVYNGELYNAAELRSALESRGHRLLTSCDTEVLLYSYMEYGGECISRLNGIYAFGIWDERDKSLFIARDRFGVKPLFYAFRGSSFIFASELKSMLAHPYIRPEIDREGLAEIFALGPSRTPGNGVFKDIWELKPAHCARLDANRFKISKYWSLESKPHEDNLEETIEKTCFYVKDAVIRQLISDVPLCSFLSGGLDSSVIASLSAKHLADTGKGSLNTYSIDYKDNGKYFEKSLFQPNQDSDYTKLAAEEFHTSHHDIIIDSPELSDSLAAAVRARDLPGMADIDSSLWLFCRQVKKDATVALSGECHIM